MSLQTHSQQSSVSFTMDLTGLSFEGRFLLVLCMISYIFTSTDAEGSCKLKAKFNLRGYKEVEKTTVVIGGMFPVHRSLVSTDSNTTNPPESVDCEGYDKISFTFYKLNSHEHLYIFSWRKTVRAIKQNLHTFK